MINLEVRLSNSKRHMCVTASHGPLVKHYVPLYRDVQAGVDRDWITRPKYHRAMYVPVPTSVKRYEAYRQELADTIDLVKSSVVREVLKDHPLRAC